MKHIATLFLSVAAFAAFAADVQKAALNDLDLDANPQVVTNVTFAGLATTNDVAAAIAAIPAPDYSPTNAELRATIEAVAPVSGDYENISNRVMRAISLPGDDGHHPSIFGPIFKGRANLADGALALTKSGQIADPGSLQLRQRWYEDAYGAISGVMWPSFLDAGNAWRWVASEDYVDAATNAIPRDFLPLSGGTMRGGVRFSYFGDYGVGIGAQHPGALVFGSNYPDYSQLKALLDLDRIPRGDPWYGQADIAFLSDIPESVTPETVTNIVRGCSLGGIWDAELEVWWTPVMVGGSLTYQATTNVNLNAEN